MPLIRSGSQKAFKKNVETEMSEHPGKEDRAQNLAISYAIKRKNQRKKMASGGLSEQGPSEGPVHSRPVMDIHDDIKCAHGGRMACNAGCYAEGGVVDISAADEKRAMPDDRHGDSNDVRENSGDKPLRDADWTGGSHRTQAAGSVDMLGRKQDTDFVSERRTNADDAYTGESEEMLDSHPTRHEDELDARKERRASADGSRTDRDLDMYADGGEVGNPKLQMSHREPLSMTDEIMSRRRKRMAEGGQVDLEANSEEDLNNEDQMSYGAGLKEQYDLDQLDEPPMDSGQKGDSRERDEEDRLDMVDMIRRRMRQSRR